MRKLIILSALVLLAPALSQAKNLEDLLVEKGVITKGEAKSAAAAQTDGHTYYNEGVRMDFADAGVTSRLNTFVQTSFTYYDNAKDTPNVTSFDVNNARIILSGSALHNEFSYKLEGDFVGGSNADGSNSAELKDGWIAWSACDWVSLTLGQQKLAYSRQFKGEPWALQFPTQSVASNFFNLGYQTGAFADTDWMDGRLKIGAAITNGLSDGEGQNLSGDDTRVGGMLNARMDVMGTMNPMQEGDMDWTEDPALNVGVAYAHMSGNRDLGAGVERAGTNNTNVDVNFKYVGWGFAAEYYISNQDNDVSEESKPQGFYAQLGYMLEPHTWEVAARYGYTDCDDGTAGGICSGMDNVNEAAVGVNYFWWKHHAKAQFAYVYQNQDVAGAGGDDLNNNKWILELTSYM